MMPPKGYIDTYLECLVKKFRRFVNDEYEIEIHGLNRFIQQNDIVLNHLTKQLEENKFTICFKGDKPNIESIGVSCKNLTQNECYYYDYQIQNLPAIIELSSKTDIPVIVILIMRIVAQTIVKTKSLYKAIVIDLDDTLWAGTLAEIGIESITDNLQSQQGLPFISFMKFIKTLANELGIFIALCSRNNSEEVEFALDFLSEDNFPLKNQIDCIVANNNDKSHNIKVIAEKLSILPDSIVLIDDNQIVRDEVRHYLPEVFVPEWNNHSELITLLIVVCIFEKNELSINTQNKRKQYKTIQIEREQNSLPRLLIRALRDNNHTESSKLYSKSNQFKFSQKNSGFDDELKSVYFEIYRENKESLGICSAITYWQNDKDLIVCNWAISCRFFEIGLEETILLYLLQISQTRNIYINYRQTEFNNKVSELLAKYPNVFEINNKSNENVVPISKRNIESLRGNTNLKFI